MELTLGGKGNNSEVFQAKLKVTQRVQHQDCGKKSQKITELGKKLMKNARKGQQDHVKLKTNRSPIHKSNTPIHKFITLLF